MGVHAVLDDLEGRDKGSKKEEMVKKTREEKRQGTNGGFEVKMNRKLKITRRKPNVKYQRK